MSTQQFHIVTVVGARPQFIKAAALSKAFSKSDNIRETIVHSGQHYDENLSGNFFEELSIPSPKYNLNIGSMRHNKMIGSFLVAFDDVLVIENPDMVVVFGDTNTTAAAAIASAKSNIPLAHVEAGLREYDKRIPEEINKLITDSIADLYFSPTQTGAENLRHQGIVDNVYVTGDISLDLLHHDTYYQDINILKQKYDLDDPYIFMTCHRESNTTPTNLCAILKGISKTKTKVILPLHPRTMKTIKENHLDKYIGENVKILEPLGFWETQTLLKHAMLAVTDSGGIIKEAYFHKTPGIIIDKQTEWVETVAEGWNIITGPDEEAIANAIMHHRAPEYHSQALGDGNAGVRITNEILQYLSSKSAKI